MIFQSYVFEQGLLFGVLALGVYLTYKILDFPDLTTDGSFVLGGSTCVILITQGTPPWVACLAAFGVGLLAGSVTGILNTVFGLTDLLCGILVMSALYSVNLRVLGGKATVSLRGFDTIFTGTTNKLFLIIAIAICVLTLLWLFLKTRLGYAIKATGDNERMVTSLGVNPHKMKIIGIALANGIIAFAGSLFFQYQNVADINLGTGVIVKGLAAIIIGTTLMGKLKKGTLLFILLGAITYEMVTVLALNAGFEVYDYKMISAVVVIVLLIVNKRMGGVNNA